MSKRKYVEVEWAKIIRSRHIAIHEYDGVDYSIVWRIITIYLPSLKSSLEKILRDLE
jgi:uncharacterized protein with HEPN domain